MKNVRKSPRRRIGSGNPYPGSHRRNLVRFYGSATKLIDQDTTPSPGILPIMEFMHVIFCPIDDIRAYAFREETSRHPEASVMAESSAPSFSHRHNKDGSWDAICMKCYLTIATAPSEAELAVAESCHHECKGLKRVVSMVASIRSRRMQDRYPNRRD